MLKDKITECVEKKKRQPMHGGFSLIEMLVALAMLVVLLSMIAPNVVGYVRKAQRLSDLVMAREIGRQVQLQMTDPVLREGIKNFYRYGSKYWCNVVDDSDPRNPYTYQVCVIAYSTYFDATVHEKMRNDATVKKHNNCISQIRPAANSSVRDEAQALFKQFRIDMGYADLGIPKYHPGSFPYGRLVSGYDKPADDYPLDTWVITQRRGDPYNIEVWSGNKSKWARPVYRLYPAYETSPLYT